VRRHREEDQAAGLAAASALVLRKSVIGACLPSLLCLEMFSKGRTRFSTSFVLNLTRSEIPKVKLGLKGRIRSF